MWNGKCSLVWYCSDGPCVRCQVRAKLVIKCQFVWTFGTGIWLVFEFHTQIPFEEYIEKLEREDILNPIFISASLNGNIRNSVIRIGIFCHTERCDSQRHTVETFKNAFGCLRIERVILISMAYWKPGDGTCFFAPAICNNAYYLVVTKVRERLIVGQVAAQALIWRDSIWRS
jgi:hypothetical protein